MAAEDTARPGFGRQLTSANDDPSGNTCMFIAQSLGPLLATRLEFAAAGNPSAGLAPLGSGLGTGTGTGTGTGLSSGSSLAQSAPADVFEVRLGGLTDPGVPGKNNQDDFFVWDSGDGQNFVIGVLDGHGRDLGALAANTAKKSLLVTLSANFDKIRSNPEATLSAAFVEAHQAVKNAFREHYQKNGWIVTETSEGYLTRKRSSGGAAICIHGGTTGTVVVVLDGRYVIVANVGDSSLLLCGSGGEVHMRPMEQWTPMGGMVPPARSMTGSEVKQGAPSTLKRFASRGQRGEIDVAVSEYSLKAEQLSACSELSRDHGPECQSEFLRMRSFRPNPKDSSIPALSFVYDTLTASKLQCPPIFQVSHGTTGEVVTRTGRGTYYKNVRNEWATLVATPAEAAYQDALAFTRSIGDLHLQAYGVSHLPEISWMDLLAYTVTPPGAAGPTETTVSGPIVLCACSDGVWDNWKFEDVSHFLLHPGRVEFALKHETSQACCVDLMQANLERARVNFGSSADNMTAVLAYMVPRTMKLAQSVGGTGIADAEEGDIKLG